MAVLVGFGQTNLCDIGWQEQGNDLNKQVDSLVPTGRRQGLPSTAEHLTERPAS